MAGIILIIIKGLCLSWNFFFSFQPKLIIFLSKLWSLNTVVQHIYPPSKPQKHTFADQT